MKLSEKEIKEINDIGIDQKGNKIIHIRTKGGRHLVAKKNKVGEVEIIGQGSHAGIARHQARMMDKSINWAESLFKSETSSMSVSTSEHHYLQAEWHTTEANKVWSEFKKSEQFDQKIEDMTNYIFHKNMAIKHFQMSGLDYRESNIHYNDILTLEQKDRPSPFDTIKLHDDFVNKNPDKEIKGIE